MALENLIFQVIPKYLNPIYLYIGLSSKCVGIISFCSLNLVILEIVLCEMVSISLSLIQGCFGDLGNLYRDSLHNEN